MNTDEFIRKQKAFFDLILKEDRPLKIAAQDTLAKQATRIFVDGKNSAGGNIGQYDTTRPMYINPSKSAGAATGSKIKGIAGLKPTVGKTGEHKFKNGKEHKTTFVRNYKELRNRIGRRIDKVDLFLSGDLKSDFSNSSTTAIPTKVNQHEYVAGLKRQINVDKVEGLTEKYGDFMPPTEQEKQNFFDVAIKEWDLMFKQALRA